MKVSDNNFFVKRKGVDLFGKNPSAVSFSNLFPCLMMFLEGGKRLVRNFFSSFLFVLRGQNFGDDPRKKREGVKTAKLD